MYRKRRPFLFYVFFLLFLSGVGMLVYAMLLLNQTQKVNTDGVDKLEIPRSGVYKLYHEYELKKDNEIVRMPVFSALETITLQPEKGVKGDVYASTVKGGHTDGESKLRQIGMIEFKKSGRYPIIVRDTPNPLVFQVSRSSDLPHPAASS